MAVRIREWKGAWWVFINHEGRRKAKHVGVGAIGKKTAREAATQIQARLALGQRAFQTDHAGITLDAYSRQWLEHIKHVLKHTTHADYKKRLDQWILPLLGNLDLRDVTREKVRSLVTEQLGNNLSPKTVQNNIRCLSSLLSQAVEDGLVQVNVALKPGKFLPKVSKRRGINPFTRQEVAALLETAKQRHADFYPLFLCAVRTGMGLDELLALQWGDLHLHGRLITVERNYTHGRVSTPKNGESRPVDMSVELQTALRDLYTGRQLEAAAISGTPCRSGSSAMPAVSFWTRITYANECSMTCSIRASFEKSASMTCGTRTPAYCFSKAGATYT